MALSSCASSSSNGRMQMTAPSKVSAVYSEWNMKLALVTEANTGSPCAGARCSLDRAFDQRVLRIGTGLAKVAFEAYPDLNQRFEKFEFIIAEKANPGTVSNSSGKVVIFRGVQKLILGDEELAFLIAREMAHVIALHHDENSATTIMFSVLAAAAMPISNLISGSAALVQTGSTSVLSTATASLASFIGSKVTIASYEPDQLHEADIIAMGLLSKLGWNRNDIAGALIASTRVMGDDSWSTNLRISAEDVLLLAAEQNSITRLNIKSNSDGKTIITVELAQTPASLPAGFMTADPPRIVLDFLNTKNGLDKSFQNQLEGDLLGTNVVQVDGRTRLVVNLSRMLQYSTKIEGSNLLITMQDINPTVAALQNTLRLAEVNLTAPSQ